MSPMKKEMTRAVHAVDPGDPPYTFQSQLCLTETSLSKNLVNLLVMCFRCQECHFRWKSSFICEGTHRTVSINSSVCLSCVAHNIICMSFIMISRCHLEYVLHIILHSRMMKPCSDLIMLGYGIISLILWFCQICLHKLHSNLCSVTCVYVRQCTCKTYDKLIM